MRALAVLLAAASAGAGAAVEVQSLGNELLRGGALFNVKMVSQCGARGPAGAVVQMALMDDATAAMVPADPQVSAADSAAAAKAKADGKRGLDTLKVMQFACAGDIRKVCSIGDPSKMTCPERVFAACPQCFPQNIMIDKKCLCTCEQKPELADCFKPKSKPTLKPTSKPSATGRLLLRASASLLEEELIELAQRRALSDESTFESMGMMDFKNKTARVQLADAMRTVKTCFANKAAQLSPACRASMTVLDNRNKKHNTTRPKPATPCCQTPKPTLPKQAMTRKPTVAGTTRKPTVAGMTRKPTMAGTTRKPTVAGTTTGKPTAAGTKPAKPTMAGTTRKPTVAGTTTGKASEVDVIDSDYSDTLAVDNDDSAYGDADELMAGIDMATAEGEDLMSEPINGTTAETLSDPVADAAWDIETADIPDPPSSIPDAPSSGSTPAGTPNEPSSTAMPAGAAVGLSAGALALVAALFVGSKTAMRLKAERTALHGAKLELAVAVPKDEHDKADEPDSTGSSVVDDVAAATAAPPSPDVKRTSVASASAASAAISGPSTEEQSRQGRRNKERKERKEQAHGASTEGEEEKQRKKQGTTLRKDEPAIDPENDL
jgi:hypothetical protein